MAMEFLSPEDREVLVLRMWQDLPFVEIGRRLELESGAARMRYYRALQRLAAKLAELRQQGLSAVVGEGPT
jgi:DNA-directed RNA polymerase specialized sigma24 family protein